MDKEVQEKIADIIIIDRNHVFKLGEFVDTPAVRANQIIQSLEELGYRKLPKDKPPLLSEKDLYDKYNHPPESEIDICDNCPIATMAMEAQREADIKHYEGK